MPKHEPILPESELIQLAATLADWSDNTSFTIYLFGSRVRGDHRPDSDVDVVIPFDQAAYDDVVWWTENNEEHFASINARLPGPLRILENEDPISDQVVTAGGSPVHRDRNVVCVWLPPKPTAASS